MDTLGTAGHVTHSLKIKYIIGNKNPDVPKLSPDR